MVCSGSSFIVPAMLDLPQGEGMPSVAKWRSERSTAVRNTTLKDQSAKRGGGGNMIKSQRNDGENISTQLEARVRAGNGDMGIYIP